MGEVVQHASGARRKSTIPFCNYAIVDRVPEFGGDATDPSFDVTDPLQAIQFDEHMFPYEGCSLDKSEFIWGVYGSMSQGHALFMAETESVKRKCKSLVLQAYYKLDNFDIVRTQVDRAMMRKTGYIHVDRLKTQFREEVKAFALEAAAKRYKGFAVARNADKSLSDLLYEYPGLVQDIFEMDKKVNMVVHQVKPSWNPKERRGVYVCTMRRVPKRILDAEVRYLPKVKINL